MMKSSLNAWSCPGNHDFKTVFKNLKAAGFAGVELNVDNENSHPANALTVNTTNAQLAEIKALSEEYELPVVSISSSQYSGGKILGDGTSAGRDRARLIMETQIRCAEALGADGILIVPGGICDNCSIAKAWNNSQEALASMADLIGKSETVKVGVENVWNGFFLSPMEMARFIDELNIKNLGAYFDVGNVEIFSYPEYWIEVLAHRIIKIHVKDFLKTGANAGTFVNLLEGSIRWNKVTSALRAVGFDGYLTAELAAMPATPEYLYRITRDALDEIIAM